MSRRLVSMACTLGPTLVLAQPASSELCAMTRVSATSTGAAGNSAILSYALSRDGRKLAFVTNATDVVPGDVNGQPDLHLRDLTTGSVTWVSAIPEAEYPGPPDLEFSADGRFLVYETGTLVHQVFVFDAQAQTSELISGVAGTHSVAGAISGDGRFVAYARAGSVFGIGQVYLHDRSTGTTTLVSVNDAGVAGNDESGMVLFGKSSEPLSIGMSVSDDGRFVAFASYATNLGGAANSKNVFVRDLQLGTTRALNVDPAGVPVAGFFSRPVLAADGSAIAFHGTTTTGALLPGIPVSSNHAYVRALMSSTTELIDVTPMNAPAASSAVDLLPRLSSDGRLVAFASSASNLVTGDAGGVDVFLRDRSAGTTVLVSRTTSGVQLGGMNGQPVLALDGALVGFLGTTAVDPNDGNSAADVLLRACVASPSIVCPGDGTATPCPCGNLGAPEHGCANSLRPEGALLLAQGIPSASSDTLALVTTSTTNSVVLYFQATEAQNSGLGVVLGDGLLCVGGSILRLGQTQAVLGASQYPAPGQQPVSIRGQIPASGGVTRVYQSRYRNVANFCTPESFNISNGLAVEWLP